MSELLNLTQINLIIDRMRARSLNVSSDYIFEAYGWHKPSFNKSSGKILPYTSWSELRAIQRLGGYLYENCPTMRSAINKMVSYVVSSGHRYELGIREVPSSMTSFKVGKKLIPEIRSIIELTMESAYPGG